MSKHYKLTSKVVVYSGPSAWRFLGLPVREAKEIKEAHKSQAKAWGSLPVKVTIKNTTWKTSLFPDTKSGTYLLPLKAEVRKKEEIADGAEVNFRIELE